MKIENAITLTHTHTLMTYAVSTDANGISVTKSAIAMTMRATSDFQLYGMYALLKNRTSCKVKMTHWMTNAICHCFIS